MINLSIINLRENIYIITRKGKVIDNMTMLELLEKTSNMVKDYWEKE